MTKKERDEIINECIAELADVGDPREECMENLEELIDRAESQLSALREDEERENG